MMQRQDIGALFFHYLGYSRIRNSVFRLRRRAVTRFVTFHDIPPEAAGQFTANLHFLKQKTNVVSIEDYFLNNVISHKINVVITFDDGYQSWVAHALPVLKELGLPATFFVSSGFVGLGAADEDEFKRSRLSMTQDAMKEARGLGLGDIRAIAQAGLTIGGHTLNHSHLGMVRDTAHARNEIVADKEKLERMTGKKIEFFAYPSGAYQNPAIDLVTVLKEAGYKGAVTTIPGFNVAATNPYLLHRELTRASMAGAVFKARVYGNHDAVRFLKEGTLRADRSQ